MGNEVLEYGVDVLFGSRNEYTAKSVMREEFNIIRRSLVTGMMAAAMVKGIQSNGVGIIKHFAVNNQETNRKSVMQSSAKERCGKSI